MKILLISVIIFSMFSIPAFSEEVKRLGMDDPSSIGLRIEEDRNEKTEGRGSLRITTQWPTSICLGEVAGLDVDDARLVFRAMVKSRIKGTAFLEMWVHLPDGQYFSRGLNHPVKDSSGWTLLQTPFILKKGQTAKKLTLNLVINGTGTVWIDDVVILKKK